MELKDLLRELIREFDEANSSDRPWAKSEGIPEFLTAANGRQRYLTTATKQALRRFASTLYENRGSDSLKMEFRIFEDVVKQAVADIHAEGPMLNDDWYAYLQLTKRDIEYRIAKLHSEYTHYLSAWTLGFEKVAPFNLGPVTFLSRGDWINGVEFSEKAINNYSGTPEENGRWKDILRDAIADPHGEHELIGLAGAVYSIVTQCQHC